MLLCLIYFNFKVHTKELFIFLKEENDGYIAKVVIKETKDSKTNGQKDNLLMYDRQERSQNIKRMFRLSGGLSGLLGDLRHRFNRRNAGINKRIFRREKITRRLT